MTARPLPRTQVSQAEETKPFFTVQVALDVTSHSKMVVENLHRYVRGGSVDLVYALTSMVGAVPPPFQVLEEEAQAETRRMVNQTFDAYTEVLAHQEAIMVNQRYFPQSGQRIEDSLLTHFEETPADLVVLGMHEDKKSRHGRYIDSVSHAVATQVASSVLILKRPPLQAKGLKVLVATDGSSYAMNAVERLTAFLPQDNTDIALLNVISMNVYSMPLVEPFVDYMPLEKALQGASQALLSQSALILEEAGYTVSEQTFLLGDPVDQILVMAEKNQADLIVVGSHGLTGFKKWLLGSVSAKVLEYSPTSVAILR